MQKFFDLKVSPYSLRNNNPLTLPKTNTSRYGTQAYKNLNSLGEFKQQIKM